MKRLFSGIQPSGVLHLGNYLGAVRNWVDLQADHDSIFCIVDYHAITQPYATDELQRRILDMAVGILACGVDPSQSTLFVQSAVPEHTELAWVLSAVTPMGELSRMTQFKEKSEQHESVNAGLFTYPVLQTADIILYKAEVVPVGADQVQHLELSREIVRHFNHRFGHTFPEPSTRLTAAKRIVGLDGQRKMSKSRDNTIGLFESSEVIMDKLAGAMTDVNRKRLKDPGDPEVCNLFDLHRHFDAPDLLDEVANACRTASRGCLDCKRALHAQIVADLEPIQERARELSARPARVYEVLEAGAARCREIAAETMREVRDRLGITRSSGLGAAPLPR